MTEITQGRSGDMAETAEQLINRVLNDDHGHSRQQGSEKCRTCRRRAVKLTKELVKAGLLSDTCSTKP